MNAEADAGGDGQERDQALLLPLVHCRRQRLRVRPTVKASPTGAASAQARRENPSQKTLGLFPGPHCYDSLVAVREEVGTGGISVIHVYR